MADDKEIRPFTDEELNDLRDHLRGRSPGEIEEILLKLVVAPHGNRKFMRGSRTQSEVGRNVKLSQSSVSRIVRIHKIKEFAKEKLGIDLSGLEAPRTQYQRARAAGISITTQRKRDRIRECDSELANRVESGEVNTEEAYRQVMAPNTRKVTLTINTEFHLADSLVDELLKHFDHAALEEVAQALLNTLEDNMHESDD